MSDILSILAAKSSKSGIAVTSIKAASRNNNLDYGSINDVRKAVFAGSNMFRVNFNFTKDAPFGPHQALGFFGGSLKSQNGGGSAFADFIPTSFSKKTGKHMSSGTSAFMCLKQKPTTEQLAQIGLLNEEAKDQLYGSLIEEIDYDYDAWQALSAEHFGSEIKIQFNVPNWNAEFVEALSEARDGEPEEMIRSMTIYFSMDKEDGASVDLNSTDILKTKDGQVVKGKLVQPKVFACFFLKETTKSARFEGGISREEIGSTIADINAMKVELNVVNSLTQQINSAGKKGNKAVSNAKTVFENRLKDEGIWNTFVEMELMELAKSTQFPGWSILAAKTYFAKLSNQYSDADYVEERVSTRNSANAIKNNPSAVDVLDVLAPNSLNEDTTSVSAPLSSRFA